MSIKATNSLGVINMAQDAHKKKYNRQLSEKALHNLDPDGINLFSLLMLHEHAQGVAVEPHYRCQAYLKMKDHEEAVKVILDVPMETFDSWLSVDEVKKMQEAAQAS